jgi:response regulator RpfG family c-di-GMP phosphodiesterase
VVPDTFLNRKNLAARKPGKRSSDERNAIKRHPMYGCEMCRELGFMKEELSIIRSHHEKWDGSGYPDELQEETHLFHLTSQLNSI